MCYSQFCTLMQKSLKLGMVIAWTISFVKKKKKFIATATCLEEFCFLAPITQLVYRCNLHWS